MKKVLIVEDEEFLIRALKDNLEVEGCSVDTASNGAEAIERVRANHPDIILLDLLMPKQDGFYVLGEMKNNPAWKLIPVVVLSNLGGDAEIKRALEMGADDYFVKSQHPIEEVIEKVKEYLEGRKHPSVAMIQERKPLEVANEVNEVESVPKERPEEHPEAHPQVIDLRKKKVD